jgi:transposase InsO family protein
VAGSLPDRWSGGLLDKSSRPQSSPRAIEPSVALTIVELRRKLFLQSRIASYTGVSKATVSRVLRRAGLSKLSDLGPVEPVQRYERETPGELLHIDIKKLGRFDKVGHRITGDRTQRARNIGWEHVFVAIDDHSRIAFTRMYPDEKRESAGAFLHEATRYFAGLRVPIQRLITDNGPAFHSAAFGAACLELGIAQKFTRAYRPQTNGKADASSNRRCANGPMGARTNTPMNVARPCPPGTTSTTGIASTMASDASRPCPASRGHARTY